MEHLKIYCENIEKEALEQIMALSDHPAYEHEYIAIMPDSHKGNGGTIGTTMTLRGRKVAPNLVGVDIGCGMAVSELGPVRIDSARLQAVIERGVPSGMNVRDVRVPEC